MKLFAEVLNKTLLESFLPNWGKSQPKAQEMSFEVIVSVNSILFKYKYEGHPISSDNDPIKQNLFL